MKIFLTGATGNVGQPVCKELIAQGHEVICLTRKRITIDGCRTVRGDLQNLNKCAAEISKADAIIHLASPRSTAREVTIKEDILGTGVLIDHWKNGNFIFMSSQVVYGTPTSTLMETSPYHPCNWYDLGKVCNEMQLEIAKISGNRKAAVSLRMALLFGAGSRCLDRQFLKSLYWNCKNKSTFIFDSERGLETYGSSFLGESDCARFVLKSLTLDKSGAYNIASGFCTWKELVVKFCQLLGKKPRFVVKDKMMVENGDFRLPQSTSLVDITKFRETTGFIPSQTLEELLENYLRNLNSMLEM